MSYFGWLDTSERDRRRMLDVIDLFQQRETVDELGIGSVRDAIADHISPGTSTIQTRARYFFFIPWIYLDLERRRVPAARVAHAARQMEVSLIAALAASDDSAGTIGIQAGPSLKRLPSAVYWAGLKRLGFRLFDGAQDRYHRQFEKVVPADHRDDSGDVDGAPGLSFNWNPHLPRPPKAFPANVSMALTLEEAEFFFDKLALHASQSLLRFLVMSGDAGDDVAFPWEHAQFHEMPPDLRLWLEQGRRYSEAMHGAALLYNLMLAEKRGDEDLIGEYRAGFAEWAAMVEARGQALRDWSVEAFWTMVRRENPRIPMPVQEFSSHWIRCIQAERTPLKLMEDARVRDLVADRERRLKGPRARLFSPAHLELWGGASGAGQNDYRWGITRTIARDILQGLGGRRAESV